MSAFQVAAVNRKTIDLWRVEEAGFPIRVVNSVGVMGIETVGDLRGISDEQLLTMRNLGRISLKHIHGYFQLCARLERGRVSFNNIEEVFPHFLDKDDYAIVAARLGFFSDSLRVKRNATTLQQLANERHKTRERIRQMQEAAMERLSSRLALTLFEPFAQATRDALEEFGGIFERTELAILRGRGIFGAINPAGALLLLSELFPDRIVEFNTCFSSLPESRLSAVEEAVIDALASAKRPMTLAQLQRTARADKLPTQDPARVLGLILDHSPRVGATIDGRYFHMAEGLGAFLIEVLKPLSRPAHYRTITNAFNERLKPLSRKGAGFILDALNAIPRFTRIDRGIYDLKAG